MKSRAWQIPSDDDCVEENTLWKPFSLEFHDSTLEKKYREITHSQWLVHDRVIRVALFFIAPIFVFTRRREWVPRWYALTWLLVALLYGPLNIYLLFMHKDIYLRYRLWSITFLRVAVSFCFAGLGQFVTLSGPSFADILTTIMSKSPCMLLLFTPISLRLSFKHHAVLQLVAFCIALMWIPAFCKTCSANPGIMQRFQQVGYGIDWLFSFTLLNVLPQPTTYPCWMMTAMLMTCVAYVLPTFLVFVFEVSSRSLFLRSRQSSKKSRSAACRYAYDAFRVAALATVSLVLATWFVLSLLRNVLHE